MKVLRSQGSKSATGTVPCVPSSVKVYSYRLPRRLRRVSEASDLALPSQSFHAIREFFGRCVATQDPSEADYFFVPLNLLQFQFRNEDPRNVISHLQYLSDKRDHILVACGDFSQRSKKNHQGEAYLRTYDWLDPFVLLAHESTSDLLPGQDIGIIPWSTLTDRPTFNTNQRPFLYSFLGELRHPYLGRDHVRSRLAEMETSAPDAFIGSELDQALRRPLERSYPAAQDAFELISRNSIFTLAPAGYGRWSYRFFQAIQWGSIPVLISDDYVKPFGEWIPYEDFTVTIAEEELDNLDVILRSFSEERIRELQSNLRSHQADFTKRAFLVNLTRKLAQNGAGHSSEADTVGPDHEGHLFRARS